MRVVFMGTPEAAVPSLGSVAERFDVAAVYTRPDRPRGRGRRVIPSPVKAAALELGLDVVQPASLKGEVDRLAPLDADAIVVVAYGMILPAAVLGVPRLGCVNVHFSLLPRWRGAAPVERAILAGDADTGVTTMLMDEGMDTGPILLQWTTPISDDDTAGTVTGRLAAMGARLLVDTLEALEAGTISPVPQAAEGATLAPKITPEEAELEFTQGAEALWRRVRAFDPAPGAFTRLGGGRLKIWRARVVPGVGEPGTVTGASDEGIDVQTGRDRLRLVEVQPEGKRRMSAAEFVRGHRVEVGRTVGDAAV